MGFNIPKQIWTVAATFTQYTRYYNKNGVMDNGIIALCYDVIVLSTFQAFCNSIHNQIHKFIATQLLGGHLVYCQTKITQVKLTISHCDTGFL